MVPPRNRAPLNGVRVLDLTSVIAGPYCTQLLGDLGADVIKVESPSGDTMRQIGPARTVGMSSQFLTLNRNKRSIVLNLRQEAAREVVYTLAASADVFVHSMKPPTASALGLDEPGLRSRNEELIYCALRGFGRNGPYGDRPAYDDVIQGGCALAALQAREGEDPRYVVTAIADKTPALFAAIGILGALYSRERGARGGNIEVPMFEVMSAYVLGEHLYGRVFEPQLGESGYKRQQSRWRKPYRTRDGFISVLLYTDEHVQSFFELVDDLAVLSDERFASVTARIDNVDDFYARVESEMSQRSTHEWLAALVELGIPAMRANTPDELLDDEHLVASKLVQLVEHPSEGRIRNVGLPIHFEPAPETILRLAPRLGEHTREVLTEAGYGEAQVDELIAAGAAAA